MKIALTGNRKSCEKLNIFLNFKYENIDLIEKNNQKKYFLMNINKYNCIFIMYSDYNFMLDILSKIEDKKTVIVIDKKFLFNKFIKDTLIEKIQQGWIIYPYVIRNYDKYYIASSIKYLNQDSRFQHIKCKIGHNINIVHWIFSVAPIINDINEKVNNIKVNKNKLYLITSKHIFNIEIEEVENSTVNDVIINNHQLSNPNYYKSLCHMLESQNYECSNIIKLIEDIYLLYDQSTHMLNY